MNFVVDVKIILKLSKTATILIMASKMVSKVLEASKIGLRDIINPYLACYAY